MSDARASRTLALRVDADDGDVVTLVGHAPDVAPLALRYRTRTGALLRIDGVVRGAFDREHDTVVLDPRGVDGVAPSGGVAIVLAVERRNVPPAVLPSRNALRPLTVFIPKFRKPAKRIELVGSASTTRPAAPRADARGDLALIGHSHLDVAWLWTYAEAARKAVRTLATAARQLEADGTFVFAQSQPQLYAFVEAREPELFARVATLIRAGRIDASVAPLWVEPDCNVPAGESLLRQLVFGIRYCESRFGTRPEIAWLPDSFGFANTLPTLLAHAGVTAFATTKLSWNDTTRFPHAQFVWEGPDGSALVAANIHSIQGAFQRGRVRTARARGDLLLVGMGDGGGGTSDAALASGASFGRWTTFAAWFATLRARAASLPVLRGELYLETHRGVLTSCHEIKARHAALERALGDAELALAWSKTLHATPFFLDEARAQLRAAWEIVLRAEFHDVLPGTAIAAVYADVRREFDTAEALVDNVTKNARSVLPHAPQRALVAAVAPVREREAYRIANDRLIARVRDDGTLVELRLRGGPNLVRHGLELAAYVDRPQRYDAWNIDRSYRKRRVRVRVTGCDATDDGLEIRYALGTSLAVARLELVPGESMLRVTLAVDWRERHVLLRFENRLAFAATGARFGTPHGAVDRSPRPRTRAERAKFEAAGQRFARVDCERRDGSASGLAFLTLDTYGWSLGHRRGATELGHSLLRGPTWPDPAADAGRHDFSFALLPFERLGMGELEAAWRRFAGRSEVPMFTSDDPAVLVTATKIADDGDGLIVRIRECDGFARDVALRCGARAFGVTCVDALEDPMSGDVRFEDGTIHARLSPFALRTFRVAINAPGKPA
jgi:alpha-mannosidase